ncbi:MAG: MATE family efflux transporter [Bryobacterales bacterium]|nr:MATE family efflux transporter [Bryobacterales bacterium]
MPSLTSPAAPGNDGILAFLKEALSGTKRDFTEGSLSRAVVLLAVPMVLEMSMESLFGFVDMLFVSKLGAAAVAAVALTEGMMSLLFGVAVGLSMSTTAMVARRVGEKNWEEAGVVAVQAVFVGLAVSGVVAVTGLLAAPHLLRGMGASEAVVATGARFTQTLLGGSCSVFLLFLLNAVFRGAGDASVAMRTLWLANAINIVLCPLLIHGFGPVPAMGVQGSAIATTIGRSSGVLFQFYMLLSGRGRLHVHASQWRLQPAVMARLVRISITGIAQVLVSSASWIGMMRLMATFGTAALAGYMMAIRTIVITILPAWGMANAAATLVGQNLGAKKPDRAERSVMLAGLLNMCFLGFVGLCFFFFARQIIGLYTHEPAVMEHGVTCLRVIAFGYLFFGWGMVLVQSFNGAGDTVTPTVVNIVCFWLWQIPLAYALSVVFDLGPRGIFYAITAAHSAMAVTGFLLFRRGKWKMVRV